MESDQGGLDDDTALDGVRLECFDSKGVFTGYVSMLEVVIALNIILGQWSLLPSMTTVESGCPNSIVQPTASLMASD